MTNSGYLQGCWEPKQLEVAGIAYADIVQRLQISKKTEKEAVAAILLKMTNEGCLDASVLIQQCIIRLQALNAISVGMRTQATIGQLLLNALSARDISASLH